MPPTNSCQNTRRPSISHDRLSALWTCSARGALAAAGFAAGLPATFTIAAGNPKGLDTNKILNDNPAMEYRRCGKTGMMISAVAMGGHLEAD